MEGKKLQKACKAGILPLPPIKQVKVCQAGISLELREGMGARAGEEVTRH